MLSVCLAADIWFWVPLTWIPEAPPPISWLALYPTNKRPLESNWAMSVWFVLKTNGYEPIVLTNAPVALQIKSAAFVELETLIALAVGSKTSNCFWGLFVLIPSLPSLETWAANIPAALNAIELVPKSM